MTRRRFTAKTETIYRDLQSTAVKMRATSLKVNQDMLEGTAEIVFDRAGTRYVFRCGKYPNPLDNLRAAQLTISLLWRALEEYGTVTEEHAIEKAFAQFFLGFAATPDDTALLLGSGEGLWWEVLGVTADADKGEIKNSYRALALRHHPDTGGSQADFIKLRTAYEHGMEQLS